MPVKHVDFWEEARSEGVDAVVCTTNNFVRRDGNLVMGRGIAEQFKAKFKYLDWNWGQIVQQTKDKGNDDYHVLIDGPRRYLHNSIYLVGLQTKRFWGDPSPIELVVESCKKLKKICDLMNWDKIVMTKPGCGNGGLKWGEVSRKIKLDERFIVCENLGVLQT